MGPTLDQAETNHKPFQSWKNQKRSRTNHPKDHHYRNRDETFRWSCSKHDWMMHKIIFHIILKMRDRNRFLDRHARVHSRCILNYNIPPILYFILLGLAFIHTIYAMTIPDSNIHKIIKWLEPSTFIPPQIIVYLLIFPVMFSSVINIMQVWWAVKE